MLEVTCYRTYKCSLSEAITNRIYIWNSAARGIVKLFSPECKEDQESCHYITITFHYWMNNKLYIIYIIYIRLMIIFQHICPTRHGQN